MLTTVTAFQAPIAEAKNVEKFHVTILDLSVIWAITQLYQ
jgi:hypothetical protein